MTKEHNGHSYIYHGDCINGKKTKLYSVWQDMRFRIYNPKCSCYNQYGGRGIKICEEWDNYLNFKNWATNNNYKDNLEIDRIDNNGDYSPDNCRFTTRSINLYNRSKKINFGLNYSKRHQRYYVRIWRNGQFYYNGSSKNIDIAHKLRDELYEKLNKENSYETR